VSDRKPPGTLELWSPDPATPARVAETARFVEETLRAADTDPESVTFVVSNLDMRAQVRPQSDPARAGLRRVIAVFENPKRAIEKHVSARPIAMALASIDVKAFPSGLEAKKPRSRNRLALIDSDFVRMMKALASEDPPPASIVRGTTRIQTRIYRVGRLNEDDTATRARMSVKGKIIDLALAPNVDPARFFEAAKSGAWTRVVLDAVWTKYSDGLEMDHGKTRVRSIEPWSPVSGKEFLAIAKHVPSMAEMADADGTDIVLGDE